MNKLKEIANRNLSGQIGIVTLAIGMPAMIMMMLLAGYQLSDNELEASLAGQLNSNQKGFQAQITLNQILKTNGTRYKIRRLPYSDSPDDLESDIEDVVHAYLGTEDHPYVEYYDFHINYADRQDLVIKNSEQWMGSDHARADIASPEGQPIYVTLNFDGKVAQPYDGAGDDYDGYSYGRSYGYGRVP